MEMWEAAREALKTAGRPMRPREIWVAIEDRGLFLTPGATPVSTLLNEMRKRLKGHRHRQQDMEPKCFSSPARGIYGLVEWNLSGDTAGGNAGPTEMGSTYRANRDRHEWCPPPVSAWRDSMEKPPMPRFNELKRASGSERDRLPTAMQLNNAIALAVKMAPSGRLLLEDLEAATLRHLNIASIPGDIPTLRRRIQMHFFDLFRSGVFSVQRGAGGGVALAPAYDSHLQEVNRRAEQAGGLPAPGSSQPTRPPQPKSKSPEPGLFAPSDEGKGLTDEPLVDLSDPTGGIIALPALPDEVVPVAPESGQPNEAEETWDPPVDHDEETRELLGELTGEADSRLTDDGPTSPPHAPPERPQTADAILNRLLAALASKPELVTERRSNELLVRVSLAREAPPLEVAVCFSAQRRLLSVRATLPWAEDASLGLLELADSQDWESILGIADQNGERVYVVKRIIPVCSETVHLLPDILLEVISEATRAHRVIERYT